MAARSITHQLLLYMLVGVALLNIGTLVSEGFRLFQNPSDNAGDMEVKLRDVAHDLPAKGIVEYYCADDEIRGASPTVLSDGTKVPAVELGVLTGFRRFYTAEYVLSPRILALYSPAERKSDLCLFLASDPLKLKEFCLRSKMRTIKTYANGVYLLRHE
jgi:hypothetical protein